jgi:hypothetical protein
MTAARFVDPLVGIVGRIDYGRVEALQERMDRDRAAWLGVDTFKRPATPAERALISPLCDERGAWGVKTRVDMCGGRYRRSWSQLAERTRRDSFAPSAGSAVNLDNDEVRTALSVFAAFTRQLRIAGRTYPAKVDKLLDRLEREYQTPSRLRQACRAEREDLRAMNAVRIGTRQAAAILGWSVRTVQRHADDLDGELVGNGFVFPESTVIEYARRLQFMGGSTGLDSMTA